MSNVTEDVTCLNDRTIRTIERSERSERSARPERPNDPNALPGPTYPSPEWTPLLCDPLTILAHSCAACRISMRSPCRGSSDGGIRKDQLDESEDDREMIAEGVHGFRAKAGSTGRLHCAQLWAVRGQLTSGNSKRAEGSGK